MSSFIVIITCKYNFVILLLITLRNSLACYLVSNAFLVTAKLFITDQDHGQMNYIINRMIYTLTDLFMYI